MTTSFSPPYAARGDVAPAPSPPSDAVDYWGLTLALWRSKFVIAAVGLATAVAIGAASFAITPTFSATTRILLTTRQAQVINIANVVDNPEFTDTAILSELAIIPSPSNLLEVAQRLNLAAVPEFNPELEPPDPIGDTIKAVRKAVRAVLNPPTESFGEATPEGIAAGILAGHVKVSQYGTSYIIEIVGESRYPRLASAIANTVAEVYIERQIEDKLAANQLAIDWLTETEASLRERLQEAERELEARRAEIFPDGSLSLDVLNQQRAALTGAFVAANADRAAAAARAVRFDALVAQGDIGAAMQFASSPTLVALVERREAARQQRAALERRAETRTADIAQLETAERDFDAQIAAEIVQLSRSLEAQIVTAEERSEEMRANLVDLERTIVEAGAQNVNLSSIERELAARSAIYDRVLNRLTETRERGELQNPDAKVVAVAIPPQTPSAPKRTLLVALGLLLGAGVAAIWVVLREVRREVFRTGDDAEAKTGAPLLAALSSGLASPRGSWMNAPPPDAAGALRRMLTLIDAGQREGAARTLLATSVLPGEGAPEFCVALARICAEDGERVAIVDCLPTRDDALKRAAAGQDKAAAGARGAGFRVLRPAEAPVGARRRPFAEEMREAIAGLLDEYERVILCAPPVLAASGVFAIARHVDAALLAFRWESTPQGAVIDALADLRALGAPISGLVMTETDFATAAAYGYVGAEAVGREVRAFARAR